MHQSLPPSRPNDEECCTISSACSSRESSRSVPWADSADAANEAHCTNILGCKFRGAVCCADVPPGQHSQGADPESVKNRQEYIAKQQRWLLFLRHCAKCQAPDNTCRFQESCRIAKQLWRHILTCSDGKCPYAR